MTRIEAIKERHEEFGGRGRPDCNHPDSWADIEYLLAELDRLNGKVIAEHLCARRNAERCLELLQDQKKLKARLAKADARCAAMPEPVKPLRMTADD